MLYSDCSGTHSWLPRMQTADQAVTDTSLSSLIKFAKTLFRSNTAVPTSNYISPIERLHIMTKVPKEL